MWFRLTLALGYRSLAECQQAITALEFTHWCAYYELEPFGYHIENYRAGIIASAVLNVNSKRVTKPLDFFKTTRNTSNWQEQLQLVEALNVAFGGKDLRSQKAQ